MQGYLYRGPTPLGPFNLSLGHGWHAFIKPPDWNTTRQWTARDGYLSTGNDWVNATTTTFPAAESLCSSSAQCRGFTFMAHDRRPRATQRIKCSFKTIAKFVPEG